MYFPMCLVRASYCATIMVLTSESCVMNDPHSYPEPDNVVVYDRLGEKLQAYMIFVRPRSANENPAHNFAIIICGRSFTFTFPNLPTIGFAMPMPDVTKCKIAGFGSRTKMPLLKNFKINHMEENKIQTCSVDAQSERICLYLRPVVPCISDLGSPLVCGGVLQGLYTPRGFPFNMSDCDERPETLFTPVYPAMEWITKVQRSLDKSYPDWITKPWAILLLSFVVLFANACIYKIVIRLVEGRFSLLMASDADNRYRNEFKTSESLQPPHKMSTPWGTPVNFA